MITPFQIYLIGQLDNWQAALCTLSTTLIVLVLMTYGALILIVDWRPYCHDPHEKLPAWRRWRTVTMVAGVLMLACGLLLPNSKTAAAMWLLPKIANNPEIQKDAGDLYQLTIRYVKDKLGEDQSIGVPRPPEAKP